MIKYHKLEIQHIFFLNQSYCSPYFLFAFVSLQISSFHAILFFWYILFTKDIEYTKTVIS